MTGEVQKLRRFRVLLGILVGIHTVLSLFGCIDICFHYTHSLDDLIAGSVIVEETLGNFGILNLISGSVLLVFLYRNRKNLYRWGFWLRLAVFALSCAEPLLANTWYRYPMGGLGRYVWTFTLQGVLVQVLAAVLLILQGWLAFRKEETQYDSQ